MATKTSPQVAKVVAAMFTRVLRENNVGVIIDVSHVRETKAGYSARVTLRHKMHQQRYIGRVDNATGKVRITKSGEVEPRTAWK